MLVLDGRMNVADIVGFIMYLSLFYSPLAVLTRLAEDLQGRRRERRESIRGSRQ